MPNHLGVTSVVRYFMHRFLFSVVRYSMQIIYLNMKGFACEGFFKASDVDQNDKQECKKGWVNFSLLFWFCTTIFAACN